MDYAEKFSLVVRMEIVHIVFLIVMQREWKVCQMDAKSSFLNGVLKEEVYVVQPPSYEVEGQEVKVYSLNKCLCGLKPELCE